MRNKGFTVIEAMIVVAILAILVAIVMGAIRDGGLDGNQPVNSPPPNSQPVNTGTQSSELAICRMVHPHYLSDYGRKRCQS